MPPTNLGYTATPANANLDTLPQLAALLVPMLPQGGRTLVSLAQYLQNNTVFNVRDFGATGLGVADDAPAIQRAINAAKAAGGGVVFLPAGTYLVNTCLNCANHGDTSVTLQGVGTSQTASMTTIRGNTGTFVIDRMGSQYMNLRGFRIWNDGTELNPSPFGVVMGRTASNQFAQFDHDWDLVVFLFSKPTASARGTIGIYNIGAEHWLPDHVRCIADAPFIMASTDVLGLPGPFGGAHSGPTSMTLCDLRQTTAGAWTNAGYEFWDTHNVSMRVYANRIGGSTAGYAIVFNSGCHAFKITGQFEEWPSFANYNSDCRGHDIDVTIVSPTTSLIGMASNVNLETFKIRINQLNGTVAGLFNAGTSTTLKASTLYLESGQFINSGSLLIKGSTILAKAMGAPIVSAAGSTYLLLADNADATFVGDMQAGGGYRQPLFGWAQPTTVTGTQTDVVLTDTVATRGRTMTRPGSITGVAVRLTNVWTAGTLTVKVQKSTDSGATWATVAGPQVAISSAVKSAQATFAKDTYPFNAGDMLRLTITTAAFTPTANDCDAVLEVET